MTASPDLRAQLQSTLGDAYTLERELGGGGMSRVFVADEVALGRKVVVKVVAPELVEGVSVERFTREVKLAARLQQANIVPVLTAGSMGGMPYYTMPFVDGLSLRARLQRGPLSVAESTGILRDVARALAYAHGKGVVHRDIKPENILLSGGAAVVTDFGIAKALSEARTKEGTQEGWTNTGLTRAGTSLGTPAYMSPEQALGDTDTDHRTDLYAWGVMAWELLAGRHPFAPHKSQAAMVAAHIREVVPSLHEARPGIPAPLAALVMQCLEKDPARRPASAPELLDAIDAASTPVPEAVPARASQKSWWQRKRVVAAGALAVVALASALLWRQSSGKSALPSAAEAASGDRSIAVLPLANLSADSTDDYFGIGLAEEMTRALSKTGVRVIGRTSAGALQARGLDERAIARELGVESLLTGSVQRDAGQVRINVSLISARDGAVTWNERYDRPLTNVFALQDEIARAVATELLGSRGGAAAAPSKVETSDPEAYALYLQGQVLFGRRTRQTVLQAIDLFERAVARDPRFARAQGALALAMNAIPYYDQGTESGTIAPRVYAAAQKAIAIDSTVAEAWGAIASAQMITYENRKSDANWRRAQALDSTISILWGWHGLNLSHMNRMAEAHERMARAQAAEPASLIARTWVAQILMADRKYARADSATRTILAMDSTYALAWDLRGEVLSYLGRHDEAVAALERNLAQLPIDRIHETEGILAYVYARSGRHPDARRVMEALRGKNRGELPAMAVLAAALEQLGDRAAALAQLERAVRRPDPWLQMYNWSERYDSLRRDPRGKAALGRIERW
jgi:serine/threonine-protein kinase